MIKKMQAGIIILILCFSSGCTLHPLGNHIAVEILKTSLKDGDSILAQMQDETSNGEISCVYYKIIDASDLSDFLVLDEMVVCTKSPEEVPAVILRFDGAWILEIYSDGTAWIYNRKLVHWNCYCSFQRDKVNELILYIKRSAN